MRHMLAVVVVLSAGLTACTGSVTDNTTPETAMVVEADQQSQWADLGIDDYRIVYEIRNLNGMGGSDSDGRFHVTVHDGEVAECTVEDAPFMASGLCLQPVHEPVDLIFAWMEVFDAQFTVVRYHSEWHFPEAIDYDFPETADDEYRIRILEFEKLLVGG